MSRQIPDKCSYRAAPADWNPEDIKAAVRKTGVSMSGLSTRHGYARDTLGKCLHRPWPDGQAIIATQIGVPPQAIWPSRYDAATGEPLTGFFSTGVLRARPGTDTQRPKSRVA